MQYTYNTRGTCSVQIIIDINDDIFDETYKKAIKVAKKVEPDFEVLS